MPRTLIHLDTDIGGDTDDLCALALVLAWPGAEPLAVTTVSDDGGRRAGYARYAHGLAGRAGVPVAAGADISLGCYSPTPETRPFSKTHFRFFAAPGPDGARLLLERRKRFTPSSTSSTALRGPKRPSGLKTLPLISL